jgi:hypothetical protein
MPGFCLAGLGHQSELLADGTIARKLRHLSTRILVAVAATQRAYESERLQGVTVIGDTQAVSSNGFLTSRMASLSCGRTAL